MPRLCGRNSAYRDKHEGWNETEKADRISKAMERDKWVDESMVTNQPSLTLARRCMTGRIKHAIKIRSWYICSCITSFRELDTTVRYSIGSIVGYLLGRYDSYLCYYMVKFH